MIATLPVLMALSWVPDVNCPTPVQAEALAPQKAEQPAQAAETITCPITKEQIPSCCCPVQQ
ncbi:hypothetical protein [Fontivita pretiosa]|uniref:hypothetical protein n=1 Tax=Fontivita pretiosa TaxID=2989684 RepID=UPI003D16FEC6